MSNKKLGINFLHTHPNKEKQLNLDKSHVIVDRDELYKLYDWFHLNLEIEKYMLAGEQIHYDANTNQVTDFDKRPNRF